MTLNTTMGDSMDRLKTIARGFLSAYNFNFDLTGQYRPRKILDVRELPFQSTGDALASYWHAVGGYMQSAIDQVESSKQIEQEK